MDMHKGMVLIEKKNLIASLWGLSNVEKIFVFEQINASQSPCQPIMVGFFSLQCKFFFFHRLKYEYIYCTNVRDKFLKISS